MSWLVKVLLIIVAAVVLSLLAIEDTGYVLISRSPWVIELSLTFFIVIIVGSFILLYAVIRFISNTWHVGERIREWQSQRRQKLSRQSLNQGLLELAQRNWKKSEKLLLKHVDDSESPLLNYLAAASAAQEQGGDKRRDDYLALAHDSMPGADVAVGLTQADLQLRHGQLEQALATLMHCRTIAPKHPHVLKLLLKLYCELQDWDKLYELLPVVRKKKLLSDDEQIKLESTVFAELIKRTTSIDDIKKCWSEAPKSVRENSVLLEQYLTKLLSHGDDDEVVEMLHKHLAKNWDSRLVHLYAQAQASDKAKQLAWAEQWQAQHSDDHFLLDALARLAVRNELWGKARAWFEASLGITPTATTYRALGELLEQLEESQQAADCYRKGLMLLES